MKIMRLSNGLGNAMFQYAAYLQLKKMYPDEDVYLDTIWYDYTGYPYELDNIFHLSTDAVDIHKIIEQEHGISFEEQLEPLRFWKEYGMDSWRDMERTVCHVLDHPTESHTEAEKVAGMWQRLHLEECVELEKPYLDGLTVVSGQYESYSIARLKEEARGNVNMNYGGSPARNFVMKLWKNKGGLTYQAIRVIGNVNRRKKFLNDILHGKKPDFTGDLPLSRLRREGNVYFNIYGNPNDCEGIRDELLSAFTFPTFASDKNEETARKIESCNAVAIHARVTSFNYGMKDAVARNYFYKAVQYIKKHQQNCKFFLFSDNPAWCKENLGVLGLESKDPIEFVDWNKGADSFRDMQLISLCKHQIIPNSTFSWWGGYLNRNPDKIFVTPYGTLPGTISF